MLTCDSKCLKPLKNFSAVCGIAGVEMLHISLNYSNTPSNSSSYLSAASPQTNYNRTTPSEILVAFYSLNKPIFPVLSKCVPQHASLSTSKTLTHRTTDPGTTPPWYNVNPYISSATFFSWKHFVIGIER